MTELREERLRIAAVGLGPENPLPDLGGPGDLHRVTNLDDLPADLRRGIEHGALHSILPCLAQDGYDRDRQPTDLPVLVLENPHLRATVLPGLGGRLHSLVDLATGRELLHSNAAFQPANLALRNAWFAGGVEWNLGSTGHWTGTCEPMYAAQVDGPDGTPVLRLWEWERTRGLITQLDLWLPEDSPMLYVGIRVTNPSDRAVPTYWWSNVAVPQSPTTRVLAPTDGAWRYGYTERLELVDVRDHEGVEVTRPMAHARAVDYFFELAAVALPDGGVRTVDRPWIASVDEDGQGLLQVSTRRLRGRKLFVWGEGRGGRRWQEWLTPTDTGHGYAEIQSGLARTQMEHLSLPADTHWEWVEAYGAASVPGAADPDWDRARATMADHVERALPETHLDDLAAQLSVLHDQVPGRRLHRGAGWGALEAARSSLTPRPGTPFTVEAEHQREAAWSSLLQGTLPDTDADVAPDGTLVSWADLLEDADDGGWLLDYHRGVARWWSGDRAGAVEAWRSSLEQRPTAWAWRNLGVAAVRARSGDAVVGTDGIVHCYRAALALAPDLRPLAVEAIQAMLTAEAPIEALAALESLPAALRADDRLRLVEVQARLAVGDPTTAESLLDEGIEPTDLREGSVGIADLWSRTQAQLGTDRPLPARYDFSMTEG